MLPEMICQRSKEFRGLDQFGNISHRAIREKRQISFTSIAPCEIKGISHKGTKDTEYATQHISFVIFAPLWDTLNFH
jgi:hypothetical protein